MGSTADTCNLICSGTHGAVGPPRAISSSHVHVASRLRTSLSFQLGSRGQIVAEQASNFGQRRIDSSSCIAVAFAGGAGAVCVVFMFMFPLNV